MMGRKPKDVKLAWRVKIMKTGCKVKLIVEDPNEVELEDEVCKHICDHFWGKGLFEIRNPCWHEAEEGADNDADDDAVIWQASVVFSPSGDPVSRAKVCRKKSLVVA